MRPCHAKFLTKKMRTVLFLQAGGLCSVRIRHTLQYIRIGSSGKTPAALMQPVLTGSRDGYSLDQVGSLGCNNR